MKVVIINHVDDDFKESLKIAIDDIAVFGVYDGEPEDNCLARNFQDCFAIVDLMTKAYEAGKRGESFEVETRQTEKT